MRRVRLPLIAVLLAGGLVASGCGVTADTTAATLNGDTVSVDTVDTLARDSAFLSATQAGTPSDSESVLPGELARGVLSFELQRVAWVQLAEQWGLSLDDGRSAVQAQIDADDTMKGLSTAANESIVDFVVARQLVTERFTTLDPTSDSDLQKLYDSVPLYWERVCFSGLSAPGTAQDEVADMLEDGRDLEEIAADVEDAQYIAPSDSNCAPTFALTGELRDAVTSTGTGETTGVVPITGTSSGDTIVVLHVDERRSLSFEDARPELVASAQQLAGDAGPAPWVSLQLQSAEINPRYGSGMGSQDDGQGGSVAIVLPPPTPVQPAGAPVLAQNGTATSGATDSGQ
jgi:hypothetical protein